MEPDESSGIVETQLRAWSTQVERLKAKVERQLAEAKKKYYESIEELREDIEAQLKKWGKETDVAEFLELRGKIESELAAVEPEIEALKDQAGHAEATARDLIDELKAQRRAWKEKMSELTHAWGGAWEDVKTGAARAWDELRPALQNAIAKFR
jgi:SMC interacting uncharacterized protein involved in chromosome segregation